MEKGRPAVRVAFMGVLFALALALSLLEGMVPMPVPLPGIRLGLSNIVVMYCLFGQGVGYAFLLAALKSLFVLMTRGLSGAALSMAGGLLSVAAMAFAKRCMKDGSYGSISVLGAVCHNTGQLAAAAFFLREGAVLWYYFPVICASGILTGTLTAIILRMTMPTLSAINNGSLTSGNEEITCGGKPDNPD